MNLFLDRCSLAVPTSLLRWWSSFEHVQCINEFHSRRQFHLRNHILRIGQPTTRV